jgi:hypothetical protein
VPVSVKLTLYLFVAVPLVLLLFLHNFGDPDELTQVLSVHCIACLGIGSSSQHLFDVLLLAADIGAILSPISSKLLELLIIRDRLDDNSTLAVDHDYLPQIIGHIGFSVGLIDAELSDLGHLLAILLEDVIVDIDQLTTLQVVDPHLLLLDDEHAEEVTVDAGEDRLAELLVLVVLGWVIPSASLEVVGHVVLDDLPAVNAKLLVRECEEPLDLLRKLARYGLDASEALEVPKVDDVCIVYRGKVWSSIQELPVNDGSLPFKLSQVNLGDNRLRGPHVCMRLIAD